jgi:hypothetical protein
VAHPKETEAASPTLVAHGFDSSAAPQDAVRKLGELRGQAGIDDATVAHALAAIAHVDAAAMLATMEAGATGALRREVRRALFRLRQRGIEPPAKAEDKSREFAIRAGLTAMLSPADREGVRIVWLSHTQMGGRIKRLFALESRDEGLLAAETAELTRREFGSELEQLKQNAGIKMIDADARLVDFILCDAYRRTPEARRGKVGNFLVLRAEVTGAPPPSEIEHPVYRELGANALQEPSPDLLKERELLEWRLPEALIKPYVDEINRSEESLIVVSAIQKRERVNEILERAITTILSGESGARIRRAFEDIAYYMFHTGRQQQASWAAAAAAMLRDGSDVKRSTFFQTWLRTQFGTVFAEEQERAAEEPRLIMTPAEAMRAQQQQRMRRR